MTELERRAQIEEAWARRLVFAESMAAERLADYIARRELGRVGDFATRLVPRTENRAPVRKRGPGKKDYARMQETIPARAKPVLHSVEDDIPEIPVSASVTTLPVTPKSRRISNFS